VLHRFYRAIVDIDTDYFYFILGTGGRVYGEAVILAGDIDAVIS
jgi:hypothetical protein